MRLTPTTRSFIPVISLLLACCVMTGCPESTTSSGGGGGVGEGTPGVPQNFEIMATGMVMIRLSWEPPVLGNTAVDGYRVYGQSYGASAATVLTDTEFTTYTHDPYLVIEDDYIYTTFDYWVVAYNSDGESPRSVTKSTHPIQVGPYELYEFDLNDAISDPKQPAGVRFLRDVPGGGARFIPFPMYDLEDIEFYLTDFENDGHDGGLQFCSIAYGSYDSADSMRIPDFYDQLEDCLFWGTALPDVFPVTVTSIMGTTYLETIPVREGYFAIYTHSRNYAVMYVHPPVDHGSGKILVDIWYQRLPDLILFGTHTPSHIP